MTDPFWAQLQTESRAWVSYNFPQRETHHPILGLFEEFGEFAEAADVSEESDALADVAIFAADVSNAYHFDLAEIVETAETMLDKPLKLLGVIGRIAHHILKGEQGIRGSTEVHMANLHTELVHVFVLLFRLSKARGLVLPRLVETTWRNVVQKRDWKKDAVTAGGLA